MKFMLMMLGTKKNMAGLATWSAEDFKRHVEFMHTFNRKLTEQGELVTAEGLDMPDNARIVRGTHDGTPVVTDGPFPETKEFLAGFWIIDVDSRERAYAVAAEASAAPGKDGVPIYIPIEVRQVGSAPDEDG
jgi:hypothetical protein